MTHLSAARSFSLSFCRSESIASCPFDILLAIAFVQSSAAANDLATCPENSPLFRER
jgi:hypothetical protein